VQSSSTASVTSQHRSGHLLTNIAGGIVGQANVSCPNGSVSVMDNLAQNSYVQGAENAGRVVGLFSMQEQDTRPISDFLSGNRALASMGTNGGIDFPAPPEIYNVHNNLNGEDFIGDLVDEVAVVAGTAKGRPGEEVEVTVSLPNNPGVAGFNLTLGFDSILLTPISVIRNSDLESMVFVSNINQNNDGTITVVWTNVDNVSVEELFTIRFRINESLNGHVEITTPINVFVTDLMHAGREDVSAKEQGGYVVVSSLLWGDVNLDGIVDISDILALARHLARIPGAELCVNALARADVDRSGVCDIRDLILIAQYVADWSGVRGIVLGIPQ
jgi:hypothetical protein